MRTTVDYGIDLGTTNSSIAVCEGATVEVLRNNANSESTPSAVYLGKNGDVVVGQRAAGKMLDDALNVHREFKLGMGSSHRYPFERGRSLTAPELSAEVLKSLRGDAQQRKGEDVRAAVITVPAAFELPQCAATQDAAKLAGLAESHLVTEPAAAAFAFSRQHPADKVFWLVYDFGGGTFDAAVVQLRDGSVNVVNHGGDNHLGGKLIDWALVEEVLAPALSKERRLTDFVRGNTKWDVAFRKLKSAVEESKILLSRSERAYIDLPNVCLDDRGDAVNLELEITRDQLHRCAMPFIERSVNYCRRVLSERRLGPGDVERVILVGGPTLAPVLRSTVADALGIPVDFSMDPMTVVAQGAAIYAATQRLERPTGATVAVPGGFDLSVDYKPVGAEPEFLVGGRVTLPVGALPSGLTLEFTNTQAQPPWSSGRIDLSPDGAFMAQLWAQGRGQRHSYDAVLRDRVGSQLATFSGCVTYMIDVEMAEPPLLQSLSVGLVGNEVETLLKKGMSLPLRKTARLRTAVLVKRGQPGAQVRIPVLEGESPHADRNNEIGAIEIPAANLQRDVPAGAEVEVTLRMDKSRVITVSAYIPILGDDEVTATLNYAEYRQAASNIDRMRAAVATEVRRLDTLRQQASDAKDAAAAAVLQEIDSERMVHDVEVSLAAATGDPDAADKAQKRLLNLRVALDRLELALEWPALVTRADKAIQLAQAVVNDGQQKVSADERATCERLEKDVRTAISARDQDTLEARVDELTKLGFQMLLRTPGFWVARLQFLEGRRAQMSSQTKASALFAQGQRAIANNEFEALKAAVIGLEDLLPEDDPGRGVDTILTRA